MSGSESDAAQSDCAAAPSSPSTMVWRSPQHLWKVYLPTVLTFGLFGCWWIYRVARDLKEGSGRDISPGSYPFAILFSFALPFAMYNLAEIADGLQPPRHSRMLGPASIAAASTIPIMGSVAGIFSPYQILSIFLLLLTPIPYVLLQVRINAIATGSPASGYARTAWRFTGWQWSAMVLGGVLFAFAGLGIYLSGELSRLGGQSLTRGERFIVPEGFQLTPPTSGWVQVEPATLSTDAEASFLGPRPDSWAVFHVYHSSDLTLNDVIADRRKAAGDLTLDGQLTIDESRSLAEPSDEVIAFASYSGRDVVLQRFHMYVTTLEAGDDIGELVVMTLSKDRLQTQAEALARSLRQPVVRDRAGK